MILRNQERSCALQRRGQPSNIGEAQRCMASREDDAIDGALSQARDAQQQFAVGRVHISGKQMPIAQRPGELGIDLQIEHAVIGACNNLWHAKAIVTQQPISLI